MSDNDYCVVMLGALLMGADRDQALQGLAKMFKTTPEKAANLLSGKSRVLRENISREEAEKLNRAVKSMGVQCVIESMDKLDQTLPKAVRPLGAAVEETPPAVEPESRPKPEPAAAADAVETSDHKVEEIHKDTVETSSASEVGAPAPSPAQPSAEPAPAASVAAPAAPVESTASEEERSRYSLSEFIDSTGQQDKGQGLFELEDARLLEVNLEGHVWIKTGAMVAYRGDIHFEREGVLEKGVGKFLKKAVTGEGARLTRAEGQGALYLADQGKKVIILYLDDEAIYVNGNDVLALEPQIDWDINIMKKVTAMMAGGLFNVRLEGKGLVAITSHYDPLTLKVTPGNPVKTDPNATIAWSGNLQPELRTDVSFKTFLGRGSGESIQMVFDGDGFVVVQPFEEVYFQSQG